MLHLQPTIIKLKLPNKNYSGLANGKPYRSYTLAKEWYGLFFSLLMQIASSIYYFALHVTGAGSFPPPLSAAKEEELLEKSRNGDLVARN